MARQVLVFGQGQYADAYSDGLSVILQGGRGGLPQPVAAAELSLGAADYDGVGTCRTEHEPAADIYTVRWTVPERGIDFGYYDFSCCRAIRPDKKC